MADNSKITRVLSIYNKLSEGKILNKHEEANIFGVDERTIQRDIDDIREYLDFDSGNSNSGATDRIM